MPSFEKRRRAVFIACFLTVLVSFCIRYGYGVLLPEMLPSLGISKAEAGVIYASFFIAYTICSPLLGLLGDRLDIRWLLTIFSAILGAGTFLMAYADSVFLASLFFVIVGIGSAATWVPVMALAQKWAADRHRGKTLALIDIGSAFSLITVSTILPRIAGAQNWQTAWMVLGAMGFLMAVLNYFMVRNPRQESSRLSSHPAAKIANVSVRTIYAGLVRDVRLWLIGLAYLFTGFAVMVPLTFLVTYASEELSFTYGGATNLVIVIGAGAIAGKIILGYLSDRIQRKNILIICGLLVAAGCGGMAWLTGNALIFFAAVFGFGYGAVWAMYAACSSDYFPGEYSGIIVGLWTLFLGAGLTLSPMLAGWLADLTGSLKSSFIMAGAVGLLSILFLIPLGKRVAIPAENQE